MSKGDKAGKIEKTLPLVTRLHMIESMAIETENALDTARATFDGRGRDVVSKLGEEKGGGVIPTLEGVEETLSRVHASALELRDMIGVES